MSRRVAVRYLACSHCYGSWIPVSNPRVCCKYCDRPFPGRRKPTGASAEPPLPDRRDLPPRANRDRRVRGPPPRERLDGARSDELADHARDDGDVSVAGSDASHRKDVQCVDMLLQARTRYAQQLHNLSSRLPVSDELERVRRDIAKEKEEKYGMLTPAQRRAQVSSHVRWNTTKIEKLDGHLGELQEQLNSLLDKKEALLARRRRLESTLNDWQAQEAALDPDVQAAAEIASTQDAVECLRSAIPRDIIVLPHVVQALAQLSEPSAGAGARGSQPTVRTAQSKAAPRPSAAVSGDSQGTGGRAWSEDIPIDRDREYPSDDEFDPDTMDWDAWRAQHGPLEGQSGQSRAYRGHPRTAHDDSSGGRHRESDG